MAKFGFNGIDDLIADFDKLAKTDDNTKYEILEAGAEVVKKAQQAVIRRLGLMDPVMPQLINSLTIKRKKKKSEIYVTLYPYGYRKKKDGGPSETANAEVGNILEYGSPDVKARHWMETANEESESERIAAMQDAWNKHLDDLNL